VPDVGIKTDKTSGPHADGILSKTPAEVVIKNVDFAGTDLATGEELLTIESVAIARDDGEAVVPGTDLTLDGSAISGTKAQLTLSKGVLGVGYQVLVTVTTDNGQTLQGLVRMTIRAA
jgi:hypothetical protein